MPEKDQSRRSTWNKKERAALVLAILKGEISVESAARQHGLTTEQIQTWRGEWLAEAEEAADPEEEGSVEAETSIRGIGAWVCALRRDSLAPILLIEAVCPADRIQRATAEWRGPGGSGKGSSKTVSFPVVHGSCPREGSSAPSLSLFTTRLADTEKFERRGPLSGWLLPPPVSGILMLVEFEAAYGPFARGGSFWRHESLEWARSQGLPLVLGALGLEADEDSPGRVRKEFDLADDVPVLAGPAMARPRAKRGGEGGLLGRLTFANLFGVGDLSFDPDYARRLLAGLRTEIAYNEF